jgi:hypothetical protein
MGVEFLSHIAVSVGATKKLQYDIRVTDITKPFSEHDAKHKIVPGHKAIVTRMLLKNDKIITGSKKGSLYVNYFGHFKDEKQVNAKCSTIGFKKPKEFI